MAGRFRRFRPSFSPCSRATASRWRCVRPTSSARPRSATTCSTKTRSTRIRRSTTTSSSSTSACSTSCPATSRRPTWSSTCRRRRTCCSKRLKERERRDAVAAEPCFAALPELNEAFNHFFFHYTATPAARGRNLADRSVLARRGARRSAAADPGHDARHALLRAPGREHVPPMRLDLGLSGRSRRSVQLMAWFKRVRKPIAAAGKSQSRTRGAVGQVSGVRAGHLQQGSGGQFARLPEVPSSLPAGPPDRLRLLFDDERGRSTIRACARPIPSTSSTPSPTRSGSRRRSASTGINGRRHLRHRPHRRRRDQRRRDGIRLHRRQHGRGRGRKDHARDRAGDRPAAAGRDRAAARAARA